jgi:intracellular sulfur oxidation DsrE/DsrF family protein
MDSKWPKWSEAIDSGRRKWLGWLGAGSVLAVGAVAARAQEPKPNDDLRFPGEPATHKVVYQFNKADAEYHRHVIFSVGAMLREYGDNIKIVVTAFGPGIHILLKQPRRRVETEIREKVASLSQYGVEFHACGNTLTSLKLAEKDLLPFAKLVPIGAADLMNLQKQGFAYVSW